MSNGAKVALAVGAGYLLGRTKRTRLALMLAAAGITGKFSSSPTELVAHGVKALGTSGQLTDLSGRVRGELLNAAKAAAVAAATNRVDALNDRLQGTASPSDVTDRAGAPVRSLSGRRSARSDGDDEDMYDTDEEDVYDEDDEPSEDDDDESSDRDEDYEDAEIVDEDEELESDEEPEPAARPRRRASRQATAPKSSTRRSARASTDGSPRRRRSAATTKRAPVRRGR